MQPAEFNKLKYYTITVKAETGKKTYPIDQNSPLNGAYVQSLWTRRAGTNVKSLQGDAIVNDTNFDAAFVILKKDTQTKVVEIPLGLIEAASKNDPQKGFPVLAYDLNWSTCTIEIPSGITADNGNVFELTISYFEKK